MNILQNFANWNNNIQSFLGNNIYNTSATAFGDLTKGWQTQLLNILGIKPTATNVYDLNSWAQAEGGALTHNQAAYNPFNTKQPGFGGTPLSNGVESYPTQQAGLAATAKSISQFPNIMKALNSTQNTPVGTSPNLSQAQNFRNQVAYSKNPSNGGTWGTGSSFANNTYLGSPQPQTQNPSNSVTGNITGSWWIRAGYFIAGMILVYTGFKQLTNDNATLMSMGSGAVSTAASPLTFTGKTATKAAGGSVTTAARTAARAPFQAHADKRRSKLTQKNAQNRYDLSTKLEGTKNQHILGQIGSRGTANQQTATHKSGLNLQEEAQKHQNRVGLAGITHQNRLTEKTHGANENIRSNITSYGPNSAVQTRAQMNYDRSQNRDTVLREGHQVKREGYGVQRERNSILQHVAITKRGTQNLRASLAGRSNMDSKGNVRRIGNKNIQITKNVGTRNRNRIKKNDI